MGGPEDDTFISEGFHYRPDYGHIHQLKTHAYRALIDLRYILILRFHSFFSWLSDLSNVALAGGVGGVGAFQAGGRNFT
jgi:hypothetical protein